MADSHPELPRDIPSRVATVIAADKGILDTFGMRVASARDGVCEMTCVVPDRLVNAAGFAHGSIAFALMDTACAYALGSLEIRGVTIDGSTSYIKGAQAGSELTTKVAVASRTRHVVTLRGEVFLLTDAGAELAAHGRFVFQLIQART